MLNIKEDSLKNASNQTVVGPHWLSIYFPVMEINREQQLFSSSKYLFLCSTYKKETEIG